MNLDKKTIERYSRQIILKGFGPEAQQKLMDSKVLVVGAGGLGCAALQYLVAAGIGTIGIIDDDVISLNNLQRQVLYTSHDIGLLKATIAKERLQALNFDINIIAYCERLTTQNALIILAGYDIIIDGTDNFASRYLINDACVLLNKTLVFGAVSQFEGQVSIFNCPLTDKSKAVNYRDLFPEPPQENEVLNCEEAGVLGVLPGIIGILQASETIKLITGIGTPLTNKLITYNSLSNEMYEIELKSNENTHLLIPSNEDAFKKMNYEWLCNPKKEIIEIDTERFDQLITTNTIDVIDVREPRELPLVNGFNHIQISLAQLNEKSIELKNETIIVFCQSGKRSLQAAQQLSTIFGTSKKVYSLMGGIKSWLNKTQNHD